MGSVFSMLTGREFAVTPQVGESLDHEAIARLQSGVTVFVKAHYTKGVTGTMLFALPLQEGTMLVDLMLGGEGTPSAELAGDSRDALAETFNQILGSANQALSDMAGETLSISNVEIFSLETGDGAGLQELLGTGPFDSLSMATTQENLKTTIHLLIPDLLVEQLRRKLGMVQAAAAAAPVASAPTPAPTQVLSAPMATGPAPAASRQSSRFTSTTRSTRSCISRLAATSRTRTSGNTHGRRSTKPAWFVSWPTRRGSCGRAMCL